MWKIVTLALFAFAIAFPFSCQAQIDPYLSQKQEQMLRTSVVVRTGRAVGAGFVVYSAEVGPQTGKKIATLIVTNHHVVESAIEGKMPVQVSWKQYDSDSREIGVITRIASVLTFDKESDLALLILHDHENRMPYVARIAPIGVKLQIMERVWTVGSTFNQPPMPSVGMIASLDQYFPGTRYIRTVMFANEGSSGGALFHFDEKRGYEVIGVLSAIFARSASRKVPLIEDKNAKPQEVDEEGKTRDEGNISYSVPPEVLQFFLKKVGRGIGIDFFK